MQNRLVFNYQISKEQSKKFYKCHISNLSIIDLTRHRILFEITLDGKQIFSCKNFAILEFLHTIAQWQMSLDSIPMQYYSMDAKINPLISFFSNNSLWKIISPFQKFEMDYSITKEELDNALNIMIKNIGVLW